MKKAKEIAKKHCLEFARKIYPNIEEHYDTPEWMIEAMKEYAREACKEQREICANEFNETEFPTYSLSGVTIRRVNQVLKTAPEPELK